MIRLYTPLPPARTGTAFYAELLLRDARQAGIPTDALQVVVEEAPPAGARTPEGYAVVSCRSVPDVVAPDEVAVFVIANNDFHAYVHASLRDVAKCAGGRVIVLLHEPGCWMLLNKLSAQRLHGFSDEALIANLGAQYGGRARSFFDQFRRGDLPRLFEFVTHGLAHVLAKADEIWTHSAFALLKLTLESNTPLSALAPFRLVEHPRFEATASGADTSPDPADEAAFTVGVFGWVAESKRVLQAIEGFYRFLCRLDAEALAQARMVVVGELPDPRHYNPVGLVQRLGIADRVAFHGFVDGPRFAALQARCAVTLNLRYPSSGETSGTLTLARSRAGAIIVSRYQGFHEAEATEGIGFLPGREIDDIAAALQRLHDAWREQVPPQPRHRPARFRKHRIETLLAGLLAPGQPVPPPAAGAADP